MSLFSPILSSLLRFMKTTTYEARPTEFRLKTGQRGIGINLLQLCKVRYLYVTLSRHPEHHWHHTSLQLKWVPGNLFPGVQRPGRDGENLTSRLGMHGATKLLHTSSYSVPISAQGLLHDS
jgi:hypothetical protein